MAPRAKTVEPDPQAEPTPDPLAPAEELEIEIDGEPIVADPVVAAPVTKTAPEPESEATTEATPDPVIAKLESDKRALEAQLARANAERQAALQRAQGAEAGRFDADIQTAQGQADKLQNDLQAAYEKGDYEQVAKIQRGLAKAEARIMTLEDRKEAATFASPTPPPQVSDPVEIVIQANPQLSRADQTWLRAHPDAVTDAGKFNQLQAVAGYAAQKFGPSTDAYYRFIEQELGYTVPETPPAPAAKPAATAPTPRKTPPYAAPPSRESGGGINTDQSRRTSKIRLTAEQHQAAKDSGVTPAEYAKNLIALVKEGKISPTSIEYV